MRWGVVAGASFLWCAAAHPASAQSEGAAEALFRDGLNLLAHGSTLEACAKFKESYRLDAANGTLQNLAACNEKAGLTATAWADWSLLVGRAAAAGQKSREELARKRSADLEKRLYRVRFVVPAGNPATSIEIDGSELARGAWSTALPLDPGPHTITFAADGYVARTQSIDVPHEPGSRDVTAPPLEHKPSPPAAPAASLAVAPTPAEPPPAPSGLRTASYVALGIGGVGLATGGVLGALAINAKAGLANHCTGSFCDEDGLRANDQARGFATGSTIAIGVGAAALATGIVLFLVSTPHATRSGHEQARQVRF